MYSLFCDSITRDILFISLKSERDEINEFYYSHFCFPLLYECGLFFEYFENKEKYLNNMGLVFIHNIRNDKTVFIWHETNNDNIKVKEVEKGVPMTSFALIPIRFKKNSIVTIIDEESFFNGINNDFKMENNINCITEYEMVYDDEMVLQKVDYFKE